MPNPFAAFADRNLTQEEEANVFKTRFVFACFYSCYINRFRTKDSEERGLGPGMDGDRRDTRERRRRPDPGVGDLRARRPAERGDASRGNLPRRGSERRHAVRVGLRLLCFGASTREGLPLLRWGQRLK